MKQQIKIPMSKYILASAIVLMGVAIGCNSDSKTESTTDTTTTSTMNTPPSGDTSLTNTTPTSDTVGAMNNSSMNNNSSANNGSMAKPNPAKKGMKGKVSVTEQKSNNTNMVADNTGVYGSAEVMPAYPGGYNKMSDYFSSNIEYPQDATDNGIEGTVEVNFAVDEAGKLSNAKVISPKIGYGIEEEALRVVNKMPTWTPGRIKGKNVKTYYTLPIRFQLY